MRVNLSVHTLPPFLIWLQSRAMESARQVYRVEYADLRCVVFQPTSTTKKVMFPTGVVVDWVHAFEEHRITTGMSAREMREAMSKSGDWASQHHSWETHLYAIIQAWSKDRASVFDLTEG